MVIKGSKLLPSGKLAEHGSAVPTDMPPVPLDDEPETKPVADLPDEPSASRVPTRFRYTPGKLEEVRAKKRH